MRSKGFTPGQLVWISQRADGWSRGYLQTERGYPKSIELKSGVPCTILRGALAKDFGVYSRHTYHGKSVGRRIAEESWLVIYNGAPTLIREEMLCKRRYKPRKTKQ